jgi:hypothetical protein
MKSVLGAASLAFASFVQDAQACSVYADITYQDIFQADLVVAGHVSNYQIVRPKNAKGRVIAEYARFDVRIGEVLKASSVDAPSPGASVTVTWDNSTFAEPDNLNSPPASRGYLIALRDPSSPLPPLRGPSAFIAPTPEPEHLTVFQAPCAQAFIFSMDSLIGIALHQWLTTDRDKEAEWEILSDFLFKNGADGVLQRQLMLERREMP